MAVVDVVGGELDDGAGFDIATWRDVVGDAGGHRAEGFAITVVVGVDEADGQLGAHGGDELADFTGLVGAQGELLVDLWSDGAVGVVPGVVDAALDEVAEPGLGEEVVDVGLAERWRRR